MTRDELRKAMEATRRPKPVPAHTPWGDLFVKIRTCAEVDEESERAKDAIGNKTRRLAYGVAQVLCDEKGELMFDPENEADVTLIAEQAWDGLSEILDKARTFKPEPEKGKAAGSS